MGRRNEFGIGFALKQANKPIIQAKFFHADDLRLER
jgi:hypothetical protein